MRAWALAFLFTQVVEVPLYLWALRRNDYTPNEKLGLALAASTITHPPLWLLVPLAGHEWYWLAVVVGEIAVFLVEGAWFRYFRVPRAFLWALVANAASLFLGMASRALVGVP